MRKTETCLSDGTVLCCNFFWVSVTKFVIYMKKFSIYFQMFNFVAKILRHERIPPEINSAEKAFYFRKHRLYHSPKYSYLLNFTKAQQRTANCKIIFSASKLNWTQHLLKSEMDRESSQAIPFKTRNKRSIFIICEGCEF